MFYFFVFSKYCANFRTVVCSKTEVRGNFSWDLSAIPLQILTIFLESMPHSKKLASKSISLVPNICEISLTIMSLKESSCCIGNRNRVDSERSVFF